MLFRRASEADQFQKYINRYGPGMVVYWCGFIDDLEAGAGDVLLADAFPPARDLITLPRLPVTLPPKPSVPDGE